MAEATTFMIEDARIMHRNFAGNETPFNNAGVRKFSVVIPEDMAEQLIEDGWNVKYTKPREEGDEPIPFIPVRVNYANRPPRIVMLTSVGRTNVSEDMVELLDWADIETIDLIVRAYNYDFKGNVGVAAYLQSMYVTIEEDALERKYANYEVEEDPEPEEQD